MSVVGSEGADKAQIDIKSVAAAIGPERGRAPVLNKEVIAIREKMKKMQGKSVFEADLAQNEEDLMVNFDEMRRVLDAEKKRIDSVDGVNDSARKKELQKRYDRLALRCNIYDKLLNNEGIMAMDMVEQKEVVNTIAALPGFAEAASVAIGGRLSAEQMMKVLSGKGGPPLTQDERSVLREVIVSMVNDDKFKNLLSKSLAANKIDDDDQVSVTKIEGLRVKQKQDEKDAKDVERYNKIKKDFEDPKSDEELDSLKERYERVQTVLGRISDENYRPITLDQEEVRKKIELVKQQISAIKETSIVSDTSNGTRTQTGYTPDQVAQREKLNGYLTSLESLDSIVGSNSNALNEYKRYADAVSKIKKYDDGEADRITRQQELLTEEGKRSKYLDKYKRKMEIALSEEMKRYWNTVSIENAAKAAEADAAIKAEKEAKDMEAKEKRVKTAEALFEKYTKLAYLKYKGGEAQGWDDEALKKFVKKDMLSRSPAQLSRDILERIIQRRGMLPPAYGKEIKQMLEGLGVGKGEPPLTVRDALNAIDTSQYETWAQEKIPDMLGYAWSRGYYFDKLQLKPGQAEFLQRAYKDGFFENAIAAKGQYIEQADRLMGGEFKDIITDGAINWKKYREKFAGKDWTEGTQKLMKLLAYAGAGFVLGGGLAWPQAGGLADTLRVGATQVGANINAIGKTAEAAATVGSQLGNLAIQKGVGSYTNFIANPSNPSQYGGVLSLITRAGSSLTPHMVSP